MWVRGRFLVLPFLTTNRARRHRALRDRRVRRCRLPKACRLWLASSSSASTPSLRGCVVAPVTKAPFGRHENLYRRSSIARKCYRGFIERASRREGLVDLNASDKIDVRKGACPHAPCALRLNARCRSRTPRRAQSTSHYCSVNVRVASEGFSRIDGRLERFRVARNARFRDRDAGIPPLERGWGECRCREPKPQEALSRATAALAPIALARCPRLWFVVKKRGKTPQLPL